MYLTDYINEVFKDADEQLQETYEILSWDDEWDDLCRSSTVTGRECGRYRGMGREQAIENVKELVFDPQFRLEYAKRMGCDVVEDNDCDPLGFDCDVRLFCLTLLEEALRHQYASLNMYGVERYDEVIERS